MNYFLTDHLGSVRVIVDGNGVVKERNDYYPFGARHVRGDCALQDGNRLKYNGKEEQITGDLDYLDYGWRMHDKMLGRWFSVDIKSEKYNTWSPYCFALNNPLRYIDPNGMDSWSTSNPAVIAQFMNSLRGSGNILESFNYKSSSWNHMSDREFFNLGNLYYDDETRLFSYSIRQDNKIVNFTLSADMQMDGFAFILDYQQALAKARAESKLRWWRRSSGAIEQDYTLDMMFIPIGKGVGILVGKGTSVVRKVGTSVLGHYPEYVKLAETIGARTFKVSTSVWNRMSATEQWAANVKFLDRMISRGDKIRLATPVNLVKPGSFYEKELNYLFEKGYKVSSDGQWLFK